MCAVISFCLTIINFNLWWLTLTTFMNGNHAIQSVQTLQAQAKHFFKVGNLRTTCPWLVYVPETWQCATGSSAGWPWQLPSWRPTFLVGLPFSKLCHKKRPALWLCSVAAGRRGLMPGSAPLPSYKGHLETPSEPRETAHDSLVQVCTSICRV